MKKINYKILFSGLLALLVFFLGYNILITRISEYTIDNKIQQFHEDNGWEIARKGWDEVLTYGLYLDLENDHSAKKIIEASEKMGLNLKKFFGKPVTEYNYKLTKKGIKNSLESHVYVYNGEIIGAYITFAEENIRVNYWPLNTKYADIINYFNENRE